VLKFFNSLFGRVVIALVAGIVIGAVFPHFAQSLRPLGDGFLKLIKMVIGPIVFCVVVAWRMPATCAKWGASASSRLSTSRS
jgi:aerobic C4-dicarboxylate transport protein